MNSPMLVRPITEGDFPALKALAHAAGIGFTSLPPEDDVLNRRIERAVQSFKGEAERAVSDYLFILETPTGEIGGCCALAGAVGLETPWYHYRSGLSVRHSKRLNTVSQMKLLFLSNDLTGTSELCTLLLTPTSRGTGAGTFLSKNRFLFIADHRELFGDQFIAEMRGCIDETGLPPFWDAVGKYFFKTDFHTVNRLASSGDKAYIAEMMLTYPLYVDMLPEKARAVISQVQPDTLPAVHLLESEGFRKSDYVDIFDGGPVMLADTARIRAIHDSKIYVTQHITRADLDHTQQKWIISNRKREDYRAILIQRMPIEGTLALTSEEMGKLNIEAGAAVRAVSLYPQK